MQYNMMQQQQSRRRRRRHPDILDSSSDEEESLSDGGDDQQQQNILPLHHQQQTKHDSTMNTDIIEESDTSVEEDDELMNPYVMNPFNDSINNGIDVYSEQALLPPSVELASLSSNTNNINNSTGDDINNDRRTKNSGENIMGVQLGLTNIREPTSQPQHINNNLQPPSVTLSNRSFDPYATNNTITTNFNANGNSGGMTNYNRELEMEEDTIEFHNPNSPIRNTNNSNASNIFGPLLNNNSEPPSNQTTNQNAHNRSIPQSRLNDASSFPCAANSFSPFPTQYNNNNSNRGKHYGENTPLSSGSNGYAPSNYAPPYNSHGGVGIGNVVSTIKSILTSSINKLSTFYHGQHTFHPNSNLHYNNNSPFTQRHNRRPKFRINVKLFGIIMGMLFMSSSMVILYHAPTIKDDNNTSGMDQGNVVNKSVYGVENNSAAVAGNSGSVVQGVSSSTGGETTGGTTNENKSLFTMENDEVKTIVMERMKKAKQHWWNKNHMKDSTATVQRGADSSNQVQQGVNNGEEENVSSSSEQQQQIINTNGNNNAVSSIEGLPAGVIVQTKEDGTVLIKLPPPPPVQQQQQINTNVGQQQIVNRLSLKEPSKLGLEGPISTKELHPLGSTKEKKLHPLGSAAKENPVLLKGGTLENENEEETMYIKLPYEKEEPTRRTLTEDEPQPLQSTKHHHTFHPPLPFESNHHKKKQEEHPGMVQELKNEFTSWMTKHDKAYNTHEEKEHRFSIWRKNHVRIKEKNLKHGPCRLTGKSVFGHNLFSDLEPEEFQSKFLTGYKGPRHDHHKNKKKKGKSHFRDGAPEGHLTPLAAGAAPSVNRHPSMQRKLDEHIAKYGTTTIAASDGNTNSNSNRLHGENKYQTKYYYGCPWWDMSCYLRKIFGYGMPGTREPIYDKDSYPTALDWRSMGAVSEVHSQGSCGACWAITAVETIESAYAIASGSLVDLSEEEVIACDGTCEMCNGGWPQNAYDYVQKHDGLPAQTQQYDDEWLYSITAVLSGEGYDVSEYEMGSYFAKTCPAGYREGGEGGAGSGSHKSGDNNGYQYDSYVSTTRYAKVKGYGYATDRCVCYTDGSGCDCDEQDEVTAIRNVASYGPAAVCLEASTWQNYEDGIMTADIGCSSSFLDMNHCVEVVGYAFTDGTSSGGDNDGNNNNSGSGSGSNDRKSGSNDYREGYWIVKNQWSSYWGMSGYAYVAMGDNTCGILNDMTQVYM